MICSLNLLMIDCCVNSWILFNEFWMIADYDSNACSWFDFLTSFCKSKMRKNRIKEIATMIDEKNDKTNLAFHRCTMIETNLNALNWSTYHCNRLNDCFQWTIFNHLTHLFNKLQRRIARSWRIQDVVEQSCENHQKSDKQKERWDWAKRWRKRFWLYFIKSKWRTKEKYYWNESHSLWFLWWYDFYLIKKYDRFHHIQNHIVVE